MTVTAWNCSIITCIELFVLPRENLADASLAPVDRPSERLQANLDYRSYFFDGPNFSSRQALFNQYSGNTFNFDMTYADGTEQQHTIPLVDAPHPPPTRLSIFQDGTQISHLEIDPALDFSVRWTDFSECNEDPNGILNDVVSIMVDVCGDGKHLYKTGVPEVNPDYLTFKDKEAIVPAGTLEEGKWYWLNGEFSNVAYTSTMDSAPAVSSNMTATFLNIRTKNGPENSPCEFYINKVE